MSRQCNIFMGERLAGIYTESDDGYLFMYNDEYFLNKSNLPISQTLPLNQKTYESNFMLPFFDGLIPEGWLLNLALDNWKLDPRDRMGLLMTCCQDCIGAVKVIHLEDE